MVAAPVAATNLTVFYLALMMAFLTISALKKKYAASFQRGTF